MKNKMNKKSIVFYVAMALIVGLCAFKAMEEKKYSVSFTEQQWNARYTWVLAAKQAIEKSNIPMDQGRPLVDSLNKFIGELGSQLIPQINPPVDSTKKKK